MAKSPRRRIVDFAIRALPDAIEDDARRILGLEVKRTARAAPKALPAPPAPLALPAPGQKLPPFAVKPKGGQWWADKGIGAMRQSDLGVRIAKLPDTDTWVVRGNGAKMKLFGSEDEARAYVNRAVSEANPNRSPENAVRRIADDALRLSPDAEGPLSQLQAWFNKAAPKYIKNDLGTPDDPMRTLAERGALHVGLSPDEWSDAAKQVLRQETIGDVLGLNQLHIPEGALPGAGYDFGANVAINMPWLKKAPVTDKLYGIADTWTLQDTMGMGHLLDEMKNALDPRSGLPPELMLRPESLERMSLPAAAERVSLINQFRAKEMERAALDAQDNPVTHIFKEYAENHPKGLRWVEMAPPKGDGPTNYDIEEELSKALKYEGDTMGHCVGGYCPDVMSGRSRIFSLRDAKGEPHVTIETQRGLSPIQDLPYDQIPEDLQSAYQNYTVSPIRETSHITTGFPGWLRKNDPDLFERYSELLTPSENIIQIKGKQNRAPKDDYLPFVQDFVKSQQFGNVGDLENTGLVRLPDGRYLTHDQMDEIIRNEGLDDKYQSYDFNARGFPRDPSYMDPEDWAQFQRHFEGYAIGGRVDADRCFCHNPLSVKKGR